MVTKSLKAVRAWVPVNHLATDMTKFVCDTLRRPYPRFAIRHLPRCGNVEATMPDGSMLRLWSRGEDGIANQVYWRGWSGHEPEALPLFYAFARHARVVLDVGAHVGLYSLTASYANPGARIFAFEPLDAARERLRMNIRLNRRENIEVLPDAVSDRCGRHPFYLVARKLGIPTSSSLSLEFMTRSTAAALTPLQVDVTTIDHFCREHGIAEISLAKLDIESLEPQAIEGMRHAIENTKPHLFVEILDGKGTDTALDELAGEFGYNIFALDADGPHLQRHIRTDARRHNYLFTSMSASELESLLKVSPAAP